MSSVVLFKICIIEVHIYICFESHLIYKWQTIFNQLNTMVSYVNIIGLCHSVAILWEIYVMRPECHVRWLRSHFKCMLITGLGQSTLVLLWKYIGRVKERYVQIFLGFYHIFFSIFTKIFPLLRIPPVTFHENIPFLFYSHLHSTFLMSIFTTNF